MKISFDPKADWDKLSDNMAAVMNDDPRTKQPDWGYTRWIDDTAHWQFVDRFLNDYDWDNRPGVIFRYADGDTEIFTDDFTIADEILAAGKEALDEEAYEMLEWVDYATELDDAISNYGHWKGFGYLTEVNDRTRIDDRSERYSDQSPATPEEAERQAEVRAKYEAMVAKYKAMANDRD